MNDDVIGAVELVARAVVGGECGRSGDGTWTPLFACGPCQAATRAPSATSVEASLAGWFDHYHGDTEFSGAEVASILRSGGR